MTTDKIQAGDVVEYIDLRSGWHHCGTAHVVNHGEDGTQPKALIYWELDCMEPSWMPLRTLSRLEAN